MYSDVNEPPITKSVWKASFLSHFAQLIFTAAFKCSLICCDYFRPYQKPANKQGVLLTETPMLGLSSSAVLEGIFASEIPKSSPVLRRSSRILSSFRRSKPPSKTENRIDEGISAEGKTTTSVLWK